MPTAGYRDHHTIQGWHDYCDGDCLRVLLGLPITGYQNHHTFQRHDNFDSDTVQGYDDRDRDRLRVLLDVPTAGYHNHYTFQRHEYFDRDHLCKLFNLPAADHLHYDHHYALSGYDNFNGTCLHDLPIIWIYDHAVQDHGDLCSHCHFYGDLHFIQDDSDRDPLLGQGSVDDVPISVA